MDFFEIQKNSSVPSVFKIHFNYQASTSDFIVWSFVLALQLHYNRVKGEIEKPKVVIIEIICWLRMSFTQNKPSHCGLKRFVN